MKDYTDVIIAPVITEKSMNAKNNVYIHLKLVKVLTKSKLKMLLKSISMLRLQALIL